MRKNDIPLEDWRKMAQVAPYNRDLGVRFEALSENGVILALSHRADLVGDPDSGALHVGVIGSLIDTTFGNSVYRCTQDGRGFATLDLRVDHLRRSTPGRDLYSVGDCYKLTSHLAFIRGCAYHESADDPIATAVAIFMFTDGALPIAFVKDKP